MYGVPVLEDKLPVTAGGLPLPASGGLPTITGVGMGTRVSPPPSSHGSLPSVPVRP